MGVIPGQERYDRAMVRELEDIIGFDTLWLGIIRRPGESYEQAAERMDGKLLTEHRKVVEAKIKAELDAVKVMSQSEAESEVFGKACRERNDLENQVARVMGPADDWLVDDDDAEVDGGYNDDDEDSDGDVDDEEEAVDGEADSVVDENNNNIEL